MARNPWTGVDALEADELRRIQGFYADALEQTIKNQKKFLKKVADVDSGKIKPPYPPEETEKIKKWREGFVREQLRQQAVIDGIMADINKAGKMAAGTIQDANIDIYSKSRDIQAEILKSEAKTLLNKEPNFAMYNKRQIGVLLQKEQSPFLRLRIRISERTKQYADGFRMKWQSLLLTVKASRRSWNVFGMWSEMPNTTPKERRKPNAHAYRHRQHMKRQPKLMRWGSERTRNGRHG